MLRRFALLLTACGALQAQQPIAPTPEKVGPPRGEDTGGYNVTNAVEFGYRWHLVGGDVGSYRDFVNYGNGPRLLSGSFTMDSKDGHGRWFDQILVTTLGLGNDPYESAMLRVQKNGLYRYDFHWRQNDYFNPGLTVAGGLHQIDTVYQVQDQDLELFPQSKYRVRAGYSRTTQNGPVLSTSQQFDASGVGLPVFENLDLRWNEFRLGGQAEFKGFQLSVMHRWDYFTEASPFFRAGAVSGPGIGVASDPTVLNTFVKATPQHGTSPGWIGYLLTNRKKWSMNARASYLEGHNDFSLAEGATGIDRFGSPANRQIAVNGNADRPFVAGDLSVSYYPTSQITIVNTTAASNLRINGPSSYTEVSNGANFGQTVFFRYLGIRLVTNSTDVNVRVRKWLGFYGGFHFTNRLVRTIEEFSLTGVPNSSIRDVYENYNTLKSGTFGIRLRPYKPLTASLEGEIGRADNPFTPVSLRNYHGINGRVDYRTRRAQLSTSYKQAYNINAPVSLSSFTSHARNYTANATWSPQDWFSIDASYMKLHLDALGGISYFAGLGSRNSLQSAFSYYLSNIHAATLGVRVDFKGKADAYFGYSLTKDTGGPHIPVDPSVAGALILDAVQTFPLTYQSPSARLSIKITPKLRWNVGYQFYNYNEEIHLFSYNQNFHANTGYTSVLWSF